MKVQLYAISAVFNEDEEYMELEDNTEPGMPVDLREKLLQANVDAMSEYATEHTNELPTLS